MPPITRYLCLLALLLPAAPVAAAVTAPDDAATCARHLEAIGRALAAYQRDRGDLPPHLSDLYPDYLTSTAVLHCPDDPTPGSPGLQGVTSDPVLPSSYIYEMSLENGAMGFMLGPAPGRLALTWRGVKMAQRVQFGNRVPVVRCWHHLQQPGTGGRPYVISLAPNDRVYRSEEFWEFDPGTAPVVLDRMRRDLSGGAGLFRHRWQPRAMGWYFYSFAGRVPAETEAQLRAAAAQLTALARVSGQDDGAMWSAAGSLWYAGDDREKAIAAYQVAARVPGRHQAGACLQLAELYREADQPDKADALLTHLPYLDQADVSYVANLMSAYRSAGQPDKAAEWQRLSALAMRGQPRAPTPSPVYGFLVVILALWLAIVALGVAGGAVYLLTRRVAR